MDIKRGEGMFQTKIILRNVNDVQEFVKIAEQCNFEILVAKNHFRFTVSGKSLLGMIAILGKEYLDVVYDGENSKFTSILNKFQIA